MADAVEILNEKINHHFNILNSCLLVHPDHGHLLLASPPDNRYPYLYPRDAACAAQVLRRIAVSRNRYDQAQTAYRWLENLAHFLLTVQAPAGSWGQRYNLQGENKSIYKQEDNTAHGISIICNYLLAAYKLQKTVPDLEAFLNAVDLGLDYALRYYYEKELNLFYSHTSIHESGIEEGYTCWVNFAYLYAMRLAEEVAEKMDRKGVISQENLVYCRHFGYSVGELFMEGDRYIRRIDPTGRMDLRPDITLLSPFYFGYVNYPKEMEKTVRFLEKQLCDPELGMIMRYLPFYNDFTIHVHAGNGPWLQYTAILAQYHYWAGNQKRGDELLHLIEKHCGPEGEIPEHLSTCARFEKFMEQEWETGLDFEKEFYKPILLEHVSFDNILEEANNMARSYHQTASKCMILNGSSPEGGYIQFAQPLMWSHLEYLRALMIREGDWWRIKRTSG